MLDEKKVGADFHPSISVNHHTFRGEYHDSNELFKAICSTMKNRPDICAVTNLNENKANRVEGIDPSLTQISPEILEKETYRRYRDHEMQLSGMDRRARMAEVVLGLVIVIILNCACIVYCKLTNKQKNVQNMQLAVNEQVS